MIMIVSETRPPPPCFGIFPSVRKLFASSSGSGIYLSCLLLLSLCLAHVT